MKKRFSLFLLMVLACFGTPPPSKAQGSPNFVETGTTTLSAGTTTSAVALPSPGPTLVLTNNGAVTVYYALGRESCTATTASWPIPAGQVRELSTAGAGSYVCAITASSSASVTVETGTGWLQISKLQGSGGGGGSGTVTNVGLALPASVFNVTGSPVSTSGTLTGAFANQTANTVFAGPSSGSAATPSFRALLAADIPSLSGIYLPLAGGTLTGVVQFPTGGLRLNGSSSGNSLLNAPATGGGTATLPAGSGTLLYAGSIAQVYPTFGIASDTGTATANSTLIQTALNASGHVLIDNCAGQEFFIGTSLIVKSNSQLEIKTGCTMGLVNGALVPLIVNHAYIVPWTNLQNSVGSIATGPQSLIWSGSTPTWVTGTAYSQAGSTATSTTYVVSNGNIYWLQTASCTSGATAPTGTGTVSDGACTWVYVTTNLTNPSGNPTNLYATINWPSHGQVIGNYVTVNPVADLPPWQASAAYFPNAIIESNSVLGQIYKQTGGGNCVSASSGNGPTGTGSGITDGTCSWTSQTYGNWATSTSYTAGQYVTSNSNIYIELTASCTSASAPTTLAFNIADGTCHWNYQGGNANKPTWGWSSANAGTVQGGLADSAFFGTFAVVGINDTNNITVVLRRLPSANFSGIPINIKQADQQIQIGGGGTIDGNYAGNSGAYGIAKEAIYIADAANVQVENLVGINLWNHLVEVNGVEQYDVGFLHVASHTSSTPNTEIFKVYGPAFDGLVHDISGLATDDVGSWQTQDAIQFAEFQTISGDIINGKGTNITSDGGNAVEIYATHQCEYMMQIALDRINIHNSITPRQPISIWAPAGGQQNACATTQISDITVSNSTIRDANAVASIAAAGMVNFVASGAGGTNGNPGTGNLQVNQFDMIHDGSPFTQNQALNTFATGRLWQTSGAGLTLNNVEMDQDYCVVGTTVNDDGCFYWLNATINQITMSHSWIAAQTAGQGYALWVNSAGSGGTTAGRIRFEDDNFSQLSAVVRYFTPQNIDFVGNYDVATSNGVWASVSVSGGTLSFDNNTANGVPLGMVRFNSGGPFSATVISQGNNILQGTSPLWFTFPSPGLLTAYGVFDQGIQQRTVTAAGTIVQLATDQYLCVNKTVGAATAVTLLTNPWQGEALEVKDCKGDGATNNLTMTPASGNIDGASTFVINTNYGAWRGTYTGSQWVTDFSR